MRLRRLLAVCAATLMALAAVTPAQASTIYSGYRTSLLARNHANSNLYSYGGGSGYLSYPLQVGSGWGGFDYGIQIKSLRGRSHDDVVVRSTDGVLRVYHSDGQRLSGGYQIGQGWGSMTAIVPADDWDGDGNPDILARRSDGGLFLYPTKGPGHWGTVRQIGWNWNAIDQIVVPGDLDGDGIPDLIGRHIPTGNLLMYPGTRSGGFGQAQVVGRGWSSFTNITSIGDMTGNGRPDIIGQRADGTLFRYTSNGRGGWSQAVQIGHGWSNMDLPGAWEATSVAGPPYQRPAEARQPFVYGTLRTGDWGYNAVVKGRTISEQVATVPGYTLWVTHNGKWPWAITASSSSTLVGQILEFPPSTLAANVLNLDKWEGYIPGADPDTLNYVRVATTTTYGDPVWIYQTTPRKAQWAMANGYRVLNGDWFNQTRARMMMPGSPLYGMQGPLAVDNSVVSVDNATKLTQCTSDLGSLNGTFLKVNFTVKAPAGSELGYVSVPAESFFAVDREGNEIDPFTNEARFCSASNDQLAAFVNDGTRASGQLTFSGDIAELYWVNDAGELVLIWRDDDVPAAPLAPETSSPADEEQPTEAGRLGEADQSVLPGDPAATGDSSAEQ